MGNPARSIPRVLAAAVLATTLAMAGAPLVRAAEGTGTSGSGTSTPATAAVTTAPTTAAPTSGSLPEGGPPALYAAEPQLPVPAGWPFSEAFPRTSGSGRYAGGAHFWTDWIYDDHGALGTGPGYVESPGAPSPATYRYNASLDPTLTNARNNGADIFRSAVGLAGEDTWWRVDWNTLVDRAIPAAAFAIDTDADPATGGLAWGANTGLLSRGIERVLVITGQGAWLYDTSSPLPVPAPAPVPIASLGGSHSVDIASRSFVVRLPRQAIGGSDRAVVRLAAGLADGAAPTFRQLDPRHGWAPGQPNVYNVSYRQAHVDEPDYQNAWFDSGQMQALTSGGDVSSMGSAVDWGRLAAGATEPEPLVTGFVNQWYVSTAEPGQGTAGGVQPNPGYLGRVQPYMAYVPTTYRPDTPAPLTFILHGLTANHNSSPGVSPKYMQQACENRGSICVSVLGRGASGWYLGISELDVWEVWKAAARNFALDPDGTIMSGTSMGGSGTYRFVANYPHLFAGAGLITPSTSNFLPAQLANLRWTPYYQYQGNADELTPITGGLATIDAMKALGYRFTFDHYVAEDHILNAVKDGFSAPAEFFGRLRRTVDPGRISYVWQPKDVNPTLGFGPRGAWWASDAVARDTKSATASIEADSRAKPFAAEPFGKARTEYTEELRPNADPSPATRKVQRWVETAPAPTENRLLVRLTNVGAVSLGIARAGLVVGPQPATVEVTTDGASAVTLTGLPSGARVSLNGGAPVSSTGGSITVPLDTGSAEITILPAPPNPDADGDGINDTPPPAEASDCSGSQWKRFNNPTFQKKKDCTDYVASH